MSEKNGVPGAATGTVEAVDLSSSAASGFTVKIDDIEEAVGNLTGLEKAHALSITADTWFRGVMVLVVCGIFIWLNWNVMSFVRAAFAQDNLNLVAKPPIPASDRLITSNVVMTLIGATVVQTGVGFVAVMSYLFPKRAAGTAGSDNQD